MPSPKILLIACADIELRALLVEELTEAGYHILEASDEADVMYHLGASQPACVILDLLIPSFNLASLGQMRADAPACPIIIVSTFLDQGMRRDALAHGVHAIMDTPPSPQYGQRYDQHGISTA